MFDDLIDTIVSKRIRNLLRRLLTDSGKRPVRQKADGCTFRHRDDTTNPIRFHLFPKSRMVNETTVRLIRLAFFDADSDASDDHLGLIRLKILFFNTYERNRMRLFF